MRTSPAGCLIPTRERKDDGGGKDQGQEGMAHSPPCHLSGAPLGTPALTPQGWAQLGSCGVTGKGWLSQGACATVSPQLCPRAPALGSFWSRSASG